MASSAEAEGSTLWKAISTGICICESPCFIEGLAVNARRRTLVAAGSRSLTQLAFHHRAAGRAQLVDVLVEAVGDAVAARDVPLAQAIDVRLAGIPLRFGFFIGVNGARRRRQQRQRNGQAKPELREFDFQLNNPAQGAWPSTRRPRPGSSPAQN